MKRISLVCAVVMSSMMWFSGCSPAEEATVAPAAGTGSSEGGEATEGSEGEEGSTSTEGTEEAKGIAALSAEDQVLANAQKICLVSGEPLGGMGTPKKLSVEGKDVFVCCESCEAPLKKDPQKYLAKLETEKK